MKAVVETNVCIAANGRSTHANVTCQLACVEFLERLVSHKSRDQIFLDDSGLILDEYKKHLHYKGQPGVGDVFFKYLHDHMYVSDKIMLVHVSQLEDEQRGFLELPVNRFDKSDRKFLAVALVGKATVVNALDTDWHEQAAFINFLSVPVKQLCPIYGSPEGVSGTVYVTLGQPRLSKTV